ncbi:MAG: carbonic anhydrase [Opitutaceae bacterium]|nr:carbonic anhydrase [Opitutaceae bacterium]
MPSPLRRFLLAGLLGALSSLPVAASPHATNGIPPDDALILLKDGNRRFVSGTAIHFQQDAKRRRETANNGQKPFAIILTCADSRVPPELLFDQGIGSLFVIRVAGNVAQTDEVATIEYGVGHLGSRLIVVLGHTKCGAVTAVVEGAHVGPNLAQLVKPIVPAVARAQEQNPGVSGGPLVAAAILANVDQAIADLQQLSPDLAGAIAHGQARVVGALYDIESGAVEFLEGSPAPVGHAAPSSGHTAPPSASHGAAPRPEAHAAPAAHPAPVSTPAHH